MANWRVNTDGYAHHCMDCPVVKSSCRGFQWSAALNDERYQEYGWDCSSVFGLCMSTCLECSGPDDYAPREALIR
jgi:hypothetical protein